MRISIEEINKLLKLSINGDIELFQNELQRYCYFDSYSDLRLDSYDIIEEIRKKEQIQNLSFKSTKELQILKFPITVVSYLRGQNILKNRNLQYNKKYSNFGLPSEMTIGIEIETSNNKICQLCSWLLEGWSEKKEITTLAPEINSPILKDNERCIEDIYLMCEYLQDLRSKDFQWMWWTCSYWS